MCHLLPARSVSIGKHHNRLGRSLLRMNNNCTSSDCGGQIISKCCKIYTNKKIYIFILSFLLTAVFWAGHVCMPAGWREVTDRRLVSKWLLLSLGWYLTLWRSTLVPAVRFLLVRLMPGGQVHLVAQELVLIKSRGPVAWDMSHPFHFLALQLTVKRG